MSVQAVAQALGLNAQYLGRVLNSEVRASERVRETVTKLLGCAEEELFWPDEPGARERFPGDAILPIVEGEEATS